MPWCHTGLGWRVRRGSLPLPLPVPRRDVMQGPTPRSSSQLAPTFYAPPRPSRSILLGKPGLALAGLSSTLGSPNNPSIYSSVSPSCLLNHTSI